MATPQETEERLRTWLISQADRERLCIGLLALDGRFTNVRPRRPKGGPDGGRDLEALMGGQREVWGAVGFRNNVTDSREDKTWVRDKFKSDLDAARAENENLSGFVFFTNVDLTPAECEELAAYARGLRLEFVEVMYRERLRVALDSPLGLAYRFQYLQLPMSDAEQAAFFAQIGGRIEDLLTGRFDHVDDKLERIEFLQECNKLVRQVAAVVTLDRAYTPAELQHFRYMVVVTKVVSSEPSPTLCVGGRDAYWEGVRAGVSTLLFGEKVMAWSQAPDELIQDTQRGVQPRQREFVSSSQMFGKGPFKTLAEFDEGTMMFWMTAPLFEVLESVAFCVNDYVLFAARRDVLASRPHSNTLDPRQWSAPLTDAEKAVPWISVGFEMDGPDLVRPELNFVLDAWRITFATFTPEKSEYGQYNIERRRRQS